MKFTTDIFSVFDKKWALLTAGNAEHFNTMTVSWGAMGTIWSKPSATVYVRHSRYTHEFMDQNEYFTLSFFPEACRPALSILGSKSGRDCDKVAEAKLTPKFLENGVTFEEAEMVMVCRKRMAQELQPENLPKDVADTFYADHDFHTMYIGEIVEILPAKKESKAVVFSIVEIIKNRKTSCWEVYDEHETKLIETLGNDPRPEFDELGVEYFYRKVKS